MKWLFNVQILLLALMTVLMACKKEDQNPTLPDASFFANPLSGEAPLTVTFTDDSANTPTAWSWDFGDGNTSEEQNPVHAYNTAGIYTVTLTVRNDDGEDTKTVADYIEVLVAAAPPCPGIPTVSDFDGNIYHTVLIGEQCWMRENLKVTHYPNGDNIPYVPDQTDWTALDDTNTEDAYCFFENNPDNPYGALYSFAAVIADNWERDNGEGQGVCPDGWHVATNEEWATLVEYLGGETIAGGKLKEDGTTHWTSPNEGATNESGFTALPGGNIDALSGIYFVNGMYGNWWSANEHLSNTAGFRQLSYDKSYISFAATYKSNGMSVRCIYND
ncbi:MAG: hypothetical protein C0593_11705 [Marinilabiliales bacterium]|nr:MAG: hypothetical protein C0593_11705 [Marinilabiliales bacterium]